MDGQLTLGENIADNGGIHTAFRAYKNMMNQTGDDQSLIGGHTLDQLFFVAFAQVSTPACICSYVWLLVPQNAIHLYAQFLQAT